MPEDVDRVQAIRNVIGWVRTYPGEPQGPVNWPLVANDFEWLLARLTAVEQERDELLVERTALVENHAAAIDDYTEADTKLAALTRYARALVEKIVGHANCNNYDCGDCIGDIKPEVQALVACLEGETPALPEVPGKAACVCGHIWTQHYSQQRHQRDGCAALADDGFYCKCQTYRAKQAGETPAGDAP